MFTPARKARHRRDLSQSGPQVTASSESYNGAIPVGGSATWGMVVTGSNPMLSGLTCSLS
jgi:hypothetical protein